MGCPFGATPPIWVAPLSRVSSKHSPFAWDIHKGRQATLFIPSALPKFSLADLLYFSSEYMKFCWVSFAVFWEWASLFFGNFFQNMEQYVMVWVTLKTCTLLHSIKPYLSQKSKVLFQKWKVWAKNVPNVHVAIIWIDYSYIIDEIAIYLN